MANWYVLFVRTGSEERVARLLRENLDTARHEPFVLKKAFPLIRKGKVTKEIKLCFPGYVFISSADDADLFLTAALPIVQNIKEAYYFLCYGGDKRDVIMRGHERAFFSALMNEEHCIDGLVGVMDGERLRITEGALAGAEDRVIRVDRHAHMAEVGVEVMGEVKIVRLMVELVDGDIGSC